MKKLLLLMGLIIGSFSVNAQLSCANSVVLESSGTYTVAEITGENPTGVCFLDEVDSSGNPLLANWYSYTAIASGDVKIVTDKTIQTSISALTGTCADLKCYSNNGNPGELNFAVEAGMTYYIVFDSYFSTASFKFNFTIGTCVAPAKINKNTNVTLTSGTLKWEAATVAPAEYEIEYGPLGFIHGEGLIVTSATNSLDLTGLETSANYDFYVRSSCGATEKSMWIGPGILALVKTVPYYTGYDTLDEIAGFARQGDPNTFFFSENAAFAQSPDLYITFNNSDKAAVDNWVYTPAMSLTAGQVINTSFYIGTTSATANRSVKVTMGMEQNKVSQTTTIYSETGLNSAGQYTERISPDFIVPTTGIYYFAFNDFSPINADPTSMFFDTFSINTGTLSTNDFVSNQFSVFPNPAKNTVNITNTSNFNVSAISLTDLNGRIVKKQSFNNVSNITMNVSDLSAGIYMMNITSDKGTTTKKIIKN